MRNNRMLIAVLAALIALPAALAVAQDHEQREERNREEHARFDDHDRQAVRDWYRDHREEFRERNRLSQEEASKLQEGAVIDRHLRRRIHALPHDLVVRLGRAPRHERYVMVGNHIVLIDSRYRVVDVIHFED